MLAKFLNDSVGYYNIVMWYTSRSLRLMLVKKNPPGCEISSTKSNCVHDFGNEEKISKKRNGLPPGIIVHNGAMVIFSACINPAFAPDARSIRKVVCQIRISISSPGSST